MSGDHGGLRNENKTFEDMEKQLLGIKIFDVLCRSSCPNHQPIILCSQGNLQDPQGACGPHLQIRSFHSSETWMHCCGAGLVLAWRSRSTKFIGDCMLTFGWDFWLTLVVSELKIHPWPLPIHPHPVRKPILDLHERFECGGGWGLERTLNEWVLRQEWRKILPSSFFRSLSFNKRNFWSSLLR